MTKNYFFMYLDRAGSARESWTSAASDDEATANAFDLIKEQGGGNLLYVHTM